MKWSRGMTGTDRGGGEEKGKEGRCGGYDECMETSLYSTINTMYSDCAQWKLPQLLFDMEFTVLFCVCIPVCQCVPTRVEAGQHWFPSSIQHLIFSDGLSPNLETESSAAWLAHNPPRSSCRHLPSMGAAPALHAKDL